MQWTDLQISQGRAIIMLRRYPLTAGDPGKQEEELLDRQGPLLGGLDQAVVGLVVHDAQTWCEHQCIQTHK